ncbi:MAG: hypothetical protein ABFS42_14055 [Candidatus Krumholzibacteriota bacterium]
MKMKILGCLGGLLLILGCGVPEHGDSKAIDRAAMRAEAAPRIMPAEREDQLLREEKDLPTAVRIGRWARRYRDGEGIEYRFGLAEGGYVKEGDLVRDDRQDCVSLMYRVTELARAESPRDAVAWALRTRFAGAPLDSLVDDRGRVDYDRPEHLDYSLDMIRSGHWGRDITGELTGAALDSAGSSRYPAGSFRTVPESGLVEAELKEGDIAWLILDPAHEAGGRLRREYGLVVGHIGIVIKEEGRPWLVHAASSGLDRWYEGGTVVAVPLAVYLELVEKYSAVMVTRF